MPVEQRELLRKRSRTTPVYVPRRPFVEPRAPESEEDPNEPDDAVSNNPTGSLIVAVSSNISVKRRKPRWKLETPEAIKIVPLHLQTIAFLMLWS